VHIYTIKKEQNKMGNKVSQLAGSASNLANSAAQLNKIQGTTAIVEAAAQLIGMAVTASATIKDQKLRREFEQQMAISSAEEQKKVSEQILSTQDQNEKRKIIAQAMVDLAKYRIDQLSKTNYVPYIIGGIVVIVAGYFMFKKSKQ
jgi:hypothetical protein